MRKTDKIIVALALLVGVLLGLLTVSCETRPDSLIISGIHYHYDKTHEVGIWTFGNEGIAVLPASSITNPQSPNK